MEIQNKEVKLRNLYKNYYDLGNDLIKIKEFPKHENSQEFNEYKSYSFIMKIYKAIIRFFYASYLTYKIKKFYKLIISFEKNISDSDIPKIGFEAWAPRYWIRKGGEDENRYHVHLLFNRKDYPDGMISLVDVLYKLYFDPKYMSLAWEKRLASLPQGEAYYSKTQIRRLITEGSVKLDWNPDYGIEEYSELEIFGKKFKVITIKDPNFKLKISNYHGIRRMGKLFFPTLFLLMYYDRFKY